MFPLGLDEWKEVEHTPIEARVTHLFRKVGEVVEELANRLEIVDPLALDIRSTDDKDPILDILSIVQDEFGTTRLELY